MRSAFHLKTRMPPLNTYENRGIHAPLTIQRLRNIVNLSVTTLFRQIGGGRVRCESEATLQLHLGRIIATAADLEMTSENETFSVELEKPLRSADGRRGRIDIWFKLRDNQGRDWRCAIELKFFKRENHREPNNRYDVFKDIARLESCADVADIGFMLVATDHRHYVDQASYSDVTSDFDFRHGSQYMSGNTLTYKTGGYGQPITLTGSYDFNWSDIASNMPYILVEIPPLGTEHEIGSPLQAG